MVFHVIPMALLIEVIEPRWVPQRRHQLVSISPTPAAAKEEATTKAKAPTHQANTAVSADAASHQHGHEQKEKASDLVHHTAPHDDQTVAEGHTSPMAAAPVLTPAVDDNDETKQPTFPEKPTLASASIAQNLHDTPHNAPRPPPPSCPVYNDADYDVPYPSH